MSQILKHWYSLRSRLYAMQKFTKNSELAFKVFPDEKFKNIIMRRHMRGNSVQNIEYQLKNSIYFYDRDFNVYHSVAKYDDGYSGGVFWKNKKEEAKKFDQSLPEKTYSYDFFIDLDAQSHKDFISIKKEAVALHLFLSENRVGHSIRFSGMGFHFIIPNKDTKLNYDAYGKKPIYPFYILLAEELKQKLKLKFIDTTIYDSRRLIKVPYSIACYGNEFYVCTPINDIKFLKNCKLSDFVPSRFGKFLVPERIYNYQASFANLEIALGHHAHGGLKNGG